MASAVSRPMARSSMQLGGAAVRLDGIAASPGSPRAIFARRSSRCRRAPTWRLVLRTLALRPRAPPAMRRHRHAGRRGGCDDASRGRGDAGAATTRRSPSTAWSHGAAGDPLPQAAAPRFGPASGCAFAACGRRAIRVVLGTCAARSESSSACMATIDCRTRSREAKSHRPRRSTRCGSARPISSARKERRPSRSSSTSRSRISRCRRDAGPGPPMIASDLQIIRLDRQPDRLLRRPRPGDLSRRSTTGSTTAPSRSASAAMRSRRRRRDRLRHARVGRARAPHPGGPRATRRSAFPRRAEPLAPGSHRRERGLRRLRDHRQPRDGRAPDGAPRRIEAGTHHGPPAIAPLLLPTTVFDDHLRLETAEPAGRARPVRHPQPRRDRPSPAAGRDPARGRHRRGHRHLRQRARAARAARRRPGADARPRCEPNLAQPRQPRGDPERAATPRR